MASANGAGISDDALSPADHAFWKRRMQDVVGSMLCDSGSYTPEQQAEQTSFISQHVLPVLGKSADRKNAPYFLTPTGCGWEPSINFTDKDASKPVVRYTLEALGPHAGSDVDLWGIKAASGILPRLASVTPGADLRWFNALLPIFTPAAEEFERAESALSPRTKPCPKCSVAFDLSGGRRSLKTYFFPPVKSIASGTKTEDLVFPALHKLSDSGPALSSSLEPALGNVEAYIRSLDEEMRVLALGIDCVDFTKEKARIKVYSRNNRIAFSAVREAMTLGGRVTDPVTLKGVEELRSVWHLMLDEPDGMQDDDWDKPSKDPTSGYSGLAFSVEIAPGETRPETKIYVPTWLYARNDAAVFDNLEKLFKQRGWLKGDEGKYRRCAENAIGKSSFSGDIMGHTYVSFAYSEKKGAYMTAYFCSPEFGTEVYRTG